MLSTLFLTYLVDDHSIMRRCLLGPRPAAFEKSRREPFKPHISTHSAAKESSDTAAPRPRSSLLAKALQQGGGEARQQGGGDQAAHQRQPEQASHGPQGAATSELLKYAEVVDDRARVLFVKNTQSRDALSSYALAGILPTTSPRSNPNLPISNRGTAPTNPSEAVADLVQGRQG